MRSFSQVDVFSAEPLLGNPVAVVHDADGLTTSRWRRSPAGPTCPRRRSCWRRPAPAPTTGCGSSRRAASCRSPGTRPWAARTRGSRPGECRPPRARSSRSAAPGWSGCAGARRGPARAAGWRSPRRRCSARARCRPTDRARIAGRCGSTSRDRRLPLDRQRPRLGRRAARRTPTPCWRCARTPRRSATSRSASVGPYPDGATDAESRCARSCPGMGIGEDPVTGSLNAGIGQWLAGDRLPASYVASQGTALGRRGRVHVELEGDDGVGRRRHGDDDPRRGRPLRSTRWTGRRR